MPIPAWITLLVLIAMFAVLISERLPNWLVFLATLTIMMTLKLAPQQALMKGFSNVGVLTVAALFPVAAGMYSTGAISMISERFIGYPKTARTANLKILPPVAIGSAFLNNTPMVAMMIPLMRDLRRRTGLTASTLLMGLSFASILGGNITLIGGAVNLVVAGMVVDAISTGQLRGMQPIAIFDLAWIGLPAAAAGLLYLIFLAPRLLSERKVRPSLHSSSRRYLAEFKVSESSSLDGKTLDEAGFLRSHDSKLVSIRREGAELMPDWERKVRGGDVLVFLASAETLPGLWTTIGLVPVWGNPTKITRHKDKLVEVIFSSTAPFIGSPMYSLLPGGALVAISQNDQATEKSLANLRVQAGDRAIIEVDDSFLAEAGNNSSLIVTRTFEGYHLKRVEYAVIATVITVAMVSLAASGAMSMLNAALLASLAMLVTGCMEAEQAWGSIQWKTLIVLGAALGLESAVTATSLSETIGRLCADLGGDSPRIALGVVFVITIIITNVISNVATAAFMFPVALSISEMLGVSFRPFAMVIMVAASCAFINPAGFQTNLMIQEEGGYTFADFAKVGFPLTVIVGIIVVPLAPLIYGL